MTPPSSVTLWIRQLKAGESGAVQKLWEAYFQRMVDLARQKLEGAPRAAADEEDVALSAFRSFCMGARAGRFSRLEDSENLWPLLVAITAHKSVDLIRSQNRRKRGGTGRASDHQDNVASGPSDSARQGNVKADDSVVSLSEIISREPTPEFATELSDQFNRLLNLLDATGDADLRRIAILKLDGHSCAQVAETLGCATRSIERKLQVIQRLWTHEIDD